MTRPSRKIIPLRKLPPRIILSRMADNYPTQFARYHSGEAPERTPVRLSYCQIIASAGLITATLAILYLLVMA